MSTRRNVTRRHVLRRAVERTIPDNTATRIVPRPVLSWGTRAV